MDENNRLILNSIKTMLGVDPSCKEFDIEITNHINTYLNVVNQLGAGVDGFVLETGDETWDDFFKENTNPLIRHTIKTYIYLKIKPLFDPSQNSFIQRAFSDECNELEYRIVSVAGGKRDGE